MGESRKVFLPSTWRRLHLNVMPGRLLPAPGLPGPGSPASVHMAHTLTHVGFRARALGAAGGQVRNVQCHGAARTAVTSLYNWAAERVQSWCFGVSFWVAPNLNTLPHTWGWGEQELPERSGSDSALRVPLDEMGLSGCGASSNPWLPAEAVSVCSSDLPH